MIRNKSRSLLVAVGIIISITLISGINIASNQMANFMIIRNLDMIKVDFTIEAQNSNDDYEDIFPVLENLVDEIDEFERAFASVHGEQNFIIQKGGGTIDFGPYMNITWQEENRVFNRTYYAGLSSNIFQDPNPDVAARFDDVAVYNDTFDFSQDGIYIDSSSARSHNLSTGDLITFGLKYSTQIYVEGDYQSVNYTVEHVNITILGEFTIPDRDAFSRVFTRWGGMGTNDFVALGNLTYIKDMAENITDQLHTLGGDAIWIYPTETKYGILVDHNSLAVMAPDQLQEQVGIMKTRIQQAGQGSFYIYGQLEGVVEEIRFFIILFQGIFLIISLPVLILGWYLSKTNWVLSYQRRRRELALLKVKGGGTRQLKRMFYLEATIIGAVGGTLGVLGGNLTSVLVLKNIFPDALTGVTFKDMVLQIVTVQYVSSSVWITGIILGTLLSLIAVRKPLRDFAALQPIDGLAKYHESTSSQIPKKKLDWFILALGIVPIGVALLSQGIVSMDDPYILYNPFIAIIFTISTPLLPIAPFALVYASVKLLCRNMKFFKAIIGQISRIFSKTISVFTNKSILRNQARSFRLVFIVAMALSFLVMASTIEATEAEYQGQMRTIATADGYRMDFYSQKIQLEGPQALFDTLWEENESLQFEAMNWYFRFQSSGLQGQTGDDIYIDYYDGPGSFYMQQIVIGGISSKNFSQQINLRDSWFVNSTAEEALAALTQIPNSTLIPVNMVEGGYLLGENISVEYKMTNGSTQEMSLIVVGAYSQLPLVTAGWNSQNVMIVDNATISDGVAESFQMVFYPEAGSEDEPFLEEIKTTMETWDPTGYAYEPWTGFDDDDDFGTIATSLISFLNLESFYLLTIVSFGIAIIMYISVNEKSRDFGLLRARGVEKKVIYKIQIAEGSTLIILGSLFTFIGIIGAAAMILQLNSLSMMGFSSMTRTLIIPWGKIGLQLLGSMVLFILSIGVAVSIETKQSDISKISDLLRADV
ncbi:MAG: FtsX-like permease family protein [Promethearchaeota archaeon]